MKLLFTFRSDDYVLPPALDIFEFVRALYQSFTDNPIETYSIIEKNIVTMGQLKNGLFFSFKENPHMFFEKFSNKRKAEHLKLEMSSPIPDLIRVEATNLCKCLGSFLAVHSLTFRQYVTLSCVKRSNNIFITVEINRRAVISQFFI